MLYFDLTSKYKGIEGEAARSFPEFCRDFFNAPEQSTFFSGIDVNCYPGLFSSRIGDLDSPIMHLSKEEIDECPLPDREGFDHLKYQELSLIDNGCKITSIMMTYGCPFSCDFCSKPVFGNQVRFRNLDKIIEEIKSIISYGYDSLWIADDLFTYDASFVKSFCNRMIEEKLHVSWSCLSRVDTAADDVVEAMKHAGCSRVYLGIESGNDHVLKLMNKHIDTSTVKATVDKFKKFGVLCAGFFIVGYPGETVDTIEETFTFALSLGLDQISFNVPYPLPGSRLYERVSNIRDDDWTIENETKFLYDSEFDTDWLKSRITETCAELENRNRDATWANTKCDC